MYFNKGKLTGETMFFGILQVKQARKQIRDAHEDAMRGSAKGTLRKR